MSYIYCITPIFQIATNNNQYNRDYKIEYSGYRYNIIFTRDSPRNILIKNNINTSKLNSISYLNSWQRLKAEYFITIQAITKKSSTNEISYKAFVLNQKILEALRLCTDSGILYNQTLMIIGKKQEKWSTLSTPNFFTRLNKRSCFNEYFDKFCDLLQILIRDQWKNNAVFDKVLKIASYYHRIILDLETIEHKFLTLMIIFESLFKKEEERNACCASLRLSKLLCKSKREQKTIKKMFYDDNKSFCKIRNQIAHGSPRLDINDVFEKFQNLYSYVSKAIVVLFLLNDSVINIEDDYYDKLTRFVENRFVEL